jgi:hypothetical protein
VSSARQEPVLFEDFPNRYPFVMIKIADWSAVASRVWEVVSDDVDRGDEREYRYSISIMAETLLWRECRAVVYVIRYPLHPLRNRPKINLCR